MHRDAGDEGTGGGGSAGRACAEGNRVGGANQAPSPSGWLVGDEEAASGWEGPAASESRPSDAGLSVSSMDAAWKRLRSGVMGSMVGDNDVVLIV